MGEEARNIVSAALKALNGAFASVGDMAVPQYVQCGHICTSERTEPAQTGSLPLSSRPLDKRETGQVLLEPRGQVAASSLPSLVMSPCHSFLLGRAACGLVGTSR